MRKRAFTAEVHGERDFSDLGQLMREAVEEQEAARKEWLQYHLKVGEWEEAAALVVTKEEQEDLDYLRDLEARQPKKPTSKRPELK